MSAFSQLAGSVAKHYQNAKHMKKAQAEKIGGGVAYNVGVKKYGKAGMMARAAAGRLRAMA